MKVVFRADASTLIGSGHIMRCLTLADALRSAGGECQFVCRDHPGNAISFVQAKGYVVHVLPRPDQGPAVCPAHSEWLGASQAEDASQSLNALGEECVDWIIVDHYALDAFWEMQLRASTKRIMVIDDLADRDHNCEILLDQTYGRTPKDYHALVKGGTELLCGSGYALLRPEFAELRPLSLARRKDPKFRSLLITMGGVDRDNITSLVLSVLAESDLPQDCTISAIMGGASPWIEQVTKVAKSLRWRTEVIVNARNMAELMTESDFAIGAAGATTWERCCLGLPTATVVVAKNQEYAASQLRETGAVEVLTLDATFVKQLQKLIQEIQSVTDKLRVMSESAAQIADGEGCRRVAQALVEQGTYDDR